MSPAAVKQNDADAALAARGKEAQSYLRDLTDWMSFYNKARREGDGQNIKTYGDLINAKLDHISHLSDPKYGTYDRQFALAWHATLDGIKGTNNYALYESAKELVWYPYLKGIVPKQAVSVPAGLNNPYEASLYLQLSPELLAKAAGGDKTSALLVAGVLWDNQKDVDYALKNPKAKDVSKELLTRLIVATNIDGVKEQLNSLDPKKASVWYDRAAFAIAVLLPVETLENAIEHPSVGTITLFVGDCTFDAFLWGMPALKAGKALVMGEKVGFSISKITLKEAGTALLRKTPSLLLTGGLSMFAYAPNIAECYKTLSDPKATSEDKLDAIGNLKGVIGNWELASWGWSTYMTPALRTFGKNIAENKALIKAVKEIFGEVQANGVTREAVAAAVDTLEKKGLQLGPSGADKKALIDELYGLFSNNEKNYKALMSLIKKNNGKVTEDLLKEADKIFAQNTKRNTVVGGTALGAALILFGVSMYDEEKGKKLLSDESTNGAKQLRGGNVLDTPW